MRRADHTPPDFGPAGTPGRHDARNPVMRISHSRASLMLTILFPGHSIGVVNSPVLTLAKCFLQLRSQLNAETVLERPHASAVRNAYPVTVLQHYSEIRVQAR